MGQVSLYRLKSTPLEKKFPGTSWYKHTWPMPRYRYGSTCNQVDKFEFKAENSFNPLKWGVQSGSHYERGFGNIAPRWSNRDK